MALRPCLVCGSPGRGSRCTEHRLGAYDGAHQRASRAAIEAEPWCHTPGGCPYPDAGSAANPLTGGHPHPLAYFDGDRAAWADQPRVPQCHRCNSGKRERA